MGVCLSNTNKCYDCGQAGHMLRNCPQKATGPNAIPVKNAASSTTGQRTNVNQRSGSNQKQGKAFALLEIREILRQ